jgi:hypothetical protein
MATAHVAANDPDQAWLSLLGRLNRQSVSRHFDAYADIDWDSPDMALDPEDARWELPADDPLGGTAWYRNLPAATRARLGCELVASKKKIGLVFESVLKRGLLEFASTLPNRPGSSSPGTRSRAGSSPRPLRATRATGRKPPPR